MPAVCGRFVMVVMEWAPSGHIALKMSFLELKRRRLKSCGMRGLWYNSSNSKLEYERYRVANLVR